MNKRKTNDDFENKSVYALHDIKDNNKDGFIMDVWEKIFELLSKISVFYINGIGRVFEIIVYQLNTLPTVEEIDGDE